MTESDRIKQKTKEFLASGGKIEHIEPTTLQDIINKRAINPDSDAEIEKGLNKDKNERLPGI